MFTICRSNVPRQGSGRATDEDVLLRNQQNVSSSRLPRLRSHPQVLLAQDHPRQGVNFTNILRAAFCQNVLNTAFLYSQFVFVFFWQKAIGKKLLVKRC